MSQEWKKPTGILLIINNFKRFRNDKMNNQKSIHHLNWRPIAVYPQLAVKTGINAAILLQQLHYWMKKSNNNTPSGEKYVYKTYEQWKKELPYISTKTIGRAVTKLTEMKLIRVDKGIHTQRYFINYDEVQKLVDEIELNINGK